MAVAERVRVMRLLQAGWLKPILFLVFLVVAWDLAIRVFNIPPYQVPKPDRCHHDAVAGVAEAARRGVAHHAGDGRRASCSRPRSAFRSRC